MNRLKLKIADTVIELRAVRGMRLGKDKYESRYCRFFYTGKSSSDIVFQIEKRGCPISFYDADTAFVSIHPVTKDKNWALLRNKNQYFIEQHISGKKQYAVINKYFNRGRIYLLPRNKDKAFYLTDIIYDLLQIILINYFSKRDGFFVHSVGLKDIDGGGYIFAGPSGSGKSTTAGIWNNYSKAVILNDDRVIVRKVKGKFFIFGTPWHGDFKDYPKSNTAGVSLRKIFFIYHSNQHQAQHLGQKEMFNFLYPNVFPVFWDKSDLKAQIDLFYELIRKVPSYKLGFKKDKSVIPFVRKLLSR